MPTYSARCVNDHAFDYFCTVAERNEPQPCPTCHHVGERTWEISGTGGGHGFPFESTHIDGTGQKIVVESLSHLRKLEKHYGVCVRGFTDYSNSSAQDGLKDAPIFRANGRDYDGPAMAPNLKKPEKKWWRE